MSAYTGAGSNGVDSDGTNLNLVSHKGKTINIGVGNEVDTKGFVRNSAG